MAHFWLEREGDWGVVALGGERLEFTGDVETPLRRGGENRPVGQPGLVMEAAGAECDTWVMMTNENVSDIHINGVELLTGMRVLRDRDEIRVGSGLPMFFSTERLPRVEEFPAVPKKVRCRRCMQFIEQGTPAVRCPKCGVWHHESEELPGWTYDTHCANCDQPTDLEGGYHWTPEVLWHAG